MASHRHPDEHLREALIERKRELERRIAEEMQRPRPDEETIRQQKRMKLALNDALLRLDRAGRAGVHVPVPPPEIQGETASRH